MRHIRAQAPTRAELAAIAARLPGGAKDLLSQRSIRYRALGLADHALTEAELLDLLAREPALLRRPIIVAPERVTVGATAAVLDVWRR